MKQRTILSACITATVFLLLVKCTAPTGGATETGNAKITSMLYNPGGTPAVNAKVCFYLHDNDPRPGKGIGPVDSTTTDASGNYTAKLDSGTYNILATLGNNATFQDSIKAVRDSTVHPSTDTLKALGSISGKIELQGSDDPRTVFILFMGSNTFTTVNDIQGNFSATNLAKGKYRVRILTTLDNYKVMDTAFEITAGTDSIIPAPIRLEYTGIPVVEGLKIGYDTLKQIVTLSWNKPTNGRAVKSYNIYRKRSDSASFVSIKGGVTDTSYSDSTGVQDQTYEYRVAVVDTNTTEGTMSPGDTIDLISAFSIVDSIILNRPFSNNPSSFAISSDLKYYVPMGSGYANHITVFNITGDSISVLENDSFTNIIQVSIARTGSIYVLDKSKDLISIFNTDESLRNWFHILPSSTKMALDFQGNVYVTHYGSAIVRYDANSEIIDSLPYVADDAGKIVVGTDGRIYDSHYPDEIRVFDTILSRQVAALNLNYGSIRPFLVQTVDSIGNLYILYREDISDGIHMSKIFVYKTTGELVGCWGHFYFDNYSLGVRDIRIVGKKAYLLIDTKPKIKILSYTLPSYF